MLQVILRHDDGNGTTVPDDAKIWEARITWLYENLLKVGQSKAVARRVSLPGGQKQRLAIGALSTSLDLIFDDFFSFRLYIGSVSAKNMAGKHKIWPSWLNQRILPLWMQTKSWYLIKVRPLVMNSEGPLGKYWGLPRNFIHNCLGGVRNGK